MSGSNTDGTLTCIGRSNSLAKKFYTSLFLNASISISLDIDECSETPGICGLGTCTNNDEGTFYECNCQNGAMTTGQNSLGSLTCVG